MQDFDAEEGEALEEEHEAETELLDALGSCITTVMRQYNVSGGKGSGTAHAHLALSPPPPSSASPYPDPAGVEHA